MGEEDLAPLDLERQRPVGEGHVELALEVIPDPEIVVAADIGDGEARAPELAEREEHAREALRDRVAVFEPEIEEVAVDVERGPLRSHAPEERQEVPLPVAIDASDPGPDGRRRRSRRIRGWA
jgi:hypothetical protein